MAGAIEAIERCAASALIMGNRAGPEPTLRIAGGIVHASSRRCHLSQRAQLALRAKVAEAPLRREQQALIVCDRGNRPHGARHLVRLNGHHNAVLNNPVAKDPPNKNVDSEQLASPGVPPNTLAELALLRRAGNCVTSHVSHSFRMHPKPGPRRHAAAARRRGRC